MELTLPVEQNCCQSLTHTRYSVVVVVLLVFFLILKNIYFTYLFDLVACRIFVASCMIFHGSRAWTLSSCGPQAEELCRAGLVALWQVESYFLDGRSNLHHLHCKTDSFSFFKMLTNSIFQLDNCFTEFCCFLLNLQKGRDICMPMANSC